jgi:hypothetical protein
VSDGEFLYTGMVMLMTLISLKTQKLAKETEYKERQAM